MDSHRFNVMLVALAGISEAVMRVLILGGTSEASELARRLLGDKRFSPTLSLAGRTKEPGLPLIPYRVGGFGGAQGLARWIADERIDAIVDATHPFATRISDNVVRAARTSGVPLLSLMRPPWKACAGDRWIRVESAREAATALGDQPCRVFLTVGRLELPAFRAAPQHDYLVRTIDAPDPSALPERAELLLQRGPFDEVSETMLMRDRGIEILVAKNSGGAATYAKVAAARRLALPVVMIERPQKPAGSTVGDAKSALAWLVSAASAHAGPASERGV
jgi:precorrin-6A/cobalt-precorrin-6A reductase